MVRATVLIPSHRHGPLLGLAVRTALQQTVVDLEVFIVLDGADQSTREVADELAATDPRVRLFENPKGLRHGEAHRHVALAEATGTIVCYLSDDDLWFPDHVGYLEELLRDADFAHSLPAVVTPEGKVTLPYIGDLSDPRHRQRLLAGNNFIPLSSAAHTLASYQELAVGWSPAPDGIPTDLAMWQKFASTPAIRMSSGTGITVLNVPARDRQGVSLDSRYTELERLAARLGEAESLRQDAIDDLLGRTARLALHARDLDGERLTLRTALERERIRSVRMTRRLRRTRNRLERVERSFPYRITRTIAGAPIIRTIVRWVGRAGSSRASR